MTDKAKIGEMRSTLRVIHIWAKTAQEGTAFNLCNVLLDIEELTEKTLKETEDEK